MSSLFRIAIALAIVCFGAHANSEDFNARLPQNPSAADVGIQVGVGVVCNSSDQIRRYLSLKTGDASIQDAIQVVNREANDERACGMAMIAFVPGDEAGNVDVTNGKMHVRQITIVAVAVDGGWQRIPDTVQYTAFFEKLESA